MLDNEVMIDDSHLFADSVCLIVKLMSFFKTFRPGQGQIINISSAPFNTLPIAIRQH